MARFVENEEEEEEEVLVIHQSTAGVCNVSADDWLSVSVGSLLFLLLNSDVDLIFNERTNQLFSQFLFRISFSFFVCYCRRLVRRVRTVSGLFQEKTNQRKARHDTTRPKWMSSSKFPTHKENNNKKKKKKKSPAKLFFPFNFIIFFFLFVIVVVV